MNGFVIFGIFIGIIVSIVAITYFMLYGIKLCQENDAIGIIFLFLSLNILGLLIGCAVLYNARHGRYKEEIEKMKLKKEQEKCKEEIESKIKLL